MPVEESFGCGGYGVGQLQAWRMHLPLRRSILWLRQSERVQRAWGGFEPRLRQVQVAAGGLEIRMAQQQLNGAQVRAGLKQMSREAVPESVRMYLLLDPPPAARAFYPLHDALGP